MMSENRPESEKTIGTYLKEFSDQIAPLEKLYEEIKKLSESTGIYSVGKTRCLEMMGDLHKEIRLLKKARRDMTKGNPSPVLVCPHCGYDGEFDVERPEHDGFRTLEPLLSPRMILEYKDQTLTLSDPDDSHDPFDMIGDPLWYAAVDEEKSEAYREMRKFMRGNWLILCGKCLGYFDGKELVTKCEIDYPCESPHDSKWRKKPKRTFSSLLGVKEG